MTLVHHIQAVAGLDLTEIQHDSLMRASGRMQAAGSPTPQSVRQDTAGTVHLTWLQLGCRIIVSLSKNGRIDTAVTMGNASSAVLPGLVTFQVQLQEFFAI